MSDISIFPIFNQDAPGVWDDFLRIRIAPMQNYDLPMSDDDVANAAQEYTDNWRHYSGNFAFGAYDGQNMVGFVNGVVHKNIAHLQQLHILPEYQRQRLGIRLLSAAQGASSVMSARRMELTSLSRARQFYERMGFDALSWTKYQKKLSQPHSDLVPVFHCVPGLARACGISVADMRQINKLHLPMFVSYDHNSNINGYIINDKNGNTLIEVRDNNPKQIVRRALERTSQAHLSHIQNIAKQR